jgi:Xaa-Pro dipeptidase
MSEDKTGVQLNKYRKEIIDDTIMTRYKYFSENEWLRRFRKIKKKIMNKGLDLVIITSPENIFYLSGFHTTGYYYFQAVVIPVDEEPFILTREMENIGALCHTWLNNCYYFSDVQNPIDELINNISKLKKYNFIGYEKGSYFFNSKEQDDFKKKINCDRLIDITGLVEDLRKTKSIEELNIMKKASFATEKAMRYGIKSIQNNLSENDIASQIYKNAFLYGGHYPACPSFIVSGPRGYIGHSTWENRIINKNEIVFLEIGGCFYRYHTAMMRTVYIGDKLPNRVKEAETIINKTLTETMKAMKPNVKISTIVKMAKKILNSGTFENNVRYGYSIGVAFSPGWSEDTVLSLHENNNELLQENMTLHIIPFLMVENIGTIGISETVRITNEGAESFFNFPRKVFLKKPNTKWDNFKIWVKSLF